MTPRPTLQQLEERNASPEEIAAAEQEVERNLVALTNKLNTYCETHNLPDLSADEILSELLYEEPRRKQHCDWMQAFVNEWEAVEGFFARKTGGGVCIADSTGRVA